MLFKLLTLVVVAGIGYFMVKKSGLLGASKTDRVEKDNPPSGANDRVSTLQQCEKCGAFYDPADGHSC